MYCSNLAKINVGGFNNLVLIIFGGIRGRGSFQIPFGGFLGLKSIREQFLTGGIFSGWGHTFGPQGDMFSAWGHKRGHSYFYNPGPGL